MDDLALLLDTARRAGDIALTFFRTDHRVWNKAGGSPVTEGDLAVNEFLQQTLLDARPDYGWLSEESGNKDDRRHHETLFIVDPIDGTRGFMRGDTRWCISLAVVHGERPVTAVLAAPAETRIYHAVSGRGAFRNGERVGVSNCRSLKEAGIAGPKSWLSNPLLQDLADPENHAIPSLAYRLALVADGTIDGAFARPDSHDWDLAASDLILAEAGGRLSDGDRDCPRYNGEALTHDLLVAANSWIHAALQDLVVKAQQERTQSIKSKRG